MLFVSLLIVVTSAASLGYDAVVIGNGEREEQENKKRKLLPNFLPNMTSILYMPHIHNITATIYQHHTMRTTRKQHIHNTYTH